MEYLKNKTKKTVTKPISKKDTFRIVLVGILVIFVMVLGIQKTITKKEKSENKEPEMKEKRTEEISFQIEENAKKEIVLQVKNDTSNKKNYDLEITNVQNELNDPTMLTYEIFVNQEQKVYRETFPKEEMKLVDGTEINAHENLEIKMILNYKKNGSEIGKNISAKLMIQEANDEETIDK